jgi:excisionase family DNA binding protein
LTANPLITSSDLANRLNVTRRTVYRMIKENQIPKKKVRGQWRFDWSEVQDHLKLDSSSRIPTSESA